MIRNWVQLSVVTLLIASVSSGWAQTSKIPRIGYLARGNGLNHDDEGFYQGLRELGYINGKNIVVELRAANGREDKLPELAVELVRLKVDIIVALQPNAARAAQKATNTIPIVIRSSGDPVEIGFVKSLAHPGGNITGVTSISTELQGKRLEILKDAVPKLARVAALRKTGADVGQLEELQATARALGLDLQAVDAKDAETFEHAFRAAAERRLQAMITLRNPLIVGNRRTIADLAVKYRLPAIYDERQFVDDGGLMSYGTDLRDVYRRAATYVDKILKGRKPADLPVEQPIKFDFVINLKAAKQIGLTIPPNVLARADRVIR
jgi:putative ABC transport system substrate-binding protein